MKPLSANSLRAWTCHFHGIIFWKLGLKYLGLIPPPLRNRGIMSKLWCSGGSKRSRRGGNGERRRGCNLLFGQIFLKLHENEENWAERVANVRNLSLWIRHYVGVKCHLILWYDNTLPNSSKGTKGVYLTQVRICEAFSVVDTDCLQGNYTGLWYPGLLRCTQNMNTSKSLLFQKLNNLFK